MYEYSKEGDEIKQRLFNLFDEWTETEDYAKRSWKSRAQRGIKSIAGMPDNVNPSGIKNRGGGTSFLDFIDNSLSQNKKISSIMAGVGTRVQNSTEASAPLTVTPVDSMHHTNTLDTFGPSLKVQNGVVRLDFLRRAADEGISFSETDANIGGGSMHPKAHIGSTGKNTLARKFHAEGISGPADINLSAHRTDSQLAVKQFDSGAEMLEAARPHLLHDKLNAEIGVAADTPRRNMVTKILTQEGIIDSGVDLFAKGADPKQIKTAKEFLTKRPDLLRAIESAIDPKEARALIKKLAGASLLGVGMLGTAADAAETGMRTKLAIESKNPVDALQAAISGAATAVGATGVGEVLGIPLEVVNVLIDQHRSGGASKIRGRSGAKRAKMKARKKP